MAWQIREVEEIEEASDDRIPTLARHAIRTWKQNPGWTIKRAVAEVVRLATLGPKTFTAICRELPKHGFKLPEEIVEGGSLEAAPLVGRVPMGKDIKADREVRPVT